VNGEFDCSLYLSLFQGRDDYLGQQTSDAYFPVQRKLDSYFLSRHFSGDLTLGLYILDQNNRCKCLCIDIDIPKNNLDNIDYKNSTAKYKYLISRLNTLLDVLQNKMFVPPESLLLEETGGRGYHIWIFLTEYIDGRIALAFGNTLKTHLDFDIEFFPKQGVLTTRRKFGNLIKLPLGIHRKYQCRSVFFILKETGPQFIEGIDANLEYLKHLKPISPEIIAHTSDNHSGVTESQGRTTCLENTFDSIRPIFKGKPQTLTSQCTAMQSIRCKAEQGIKLNRSEAFQFANIMLSIPGGHDYIHDTMRLSYGNNYDHKKTDTELDKIKLLHPTSCLILVQQSFCAKYCKESVRRKNEDSLLPNTSPCSVWLEIEHADVLPDTTDLLERIGDPENVKLAYLKLKQYHEYEDVLFYDTFDFEHFENDLDSNCAIIAKALSEKIELPFTGFLPVSIPKKLDDAGGLECRKMAYLTVYDHVPIQSIFNIIAPIIENGFNNCSYGYRWNSDVRTNHRIFCDWRETYPLFRDSILSVLRKSPEGFHVCCDIKGYYDNIDHAILLEQLRAIIPDTHIYESLTKIVRLYKFNEPDKGLPQGPAYARLLANLYLNDFDNFATKLGTHYYRYVDDLVFMFENEHDAEIGLKNIVERLHELGLELSQDPVKRPTIEHNTDTTRLQKTLDKIQYGILEGTRHIKHLDTKTVNDFYDIIAKHSGSPADLEQLLNINDALPTLLYTFSKDSSTTHPYKKKLVDIIRFLAQHHYFFPKRIKIIFYRLLEIESDKKTLLAIYDHLNSAHKVYFMLSVFGSWKKKKEHKELLISILDKALIDPDAFVCGFSLAISADPSFDLLFKESSSKLLLTVKSADSYFLLAKLLENINYLEISIDQRTKVRDLIGTGSLDHLKMHIFTNLVTHPTRLDDRKYLETILNNSSVFLLKAVCRLVAIATDESQFFEKLIEFSLSKPSFKPLIVPLLRKVVFEKHAYSGLAELQNLQHLYGYKLLDPEIKGILLQVLDRITSYGHACDIDFAKLHTRIDVYNECYLFEHTKDEAAYDYLELIPEQRFHEYIGCNIDTAKVIIEDLSEKAILLPLQQFSYVSDQREIRLYFRAGRKCKVFTRGMYSRDNNSICRAMNLVSQIYKKVWYFTRLTGKVPLVTIKNLLLDPTDNIVVFQTVGRSLATPYSISSLTIGNEESDLPKMISNLLKDLFFKNEKEVSDFFSSKPLSGAEAFLKQCIKNMEGKEPKHRYSCGRFEYLVDQLTTSSGISNYQICVSYLRERLKGELFKFNTDQITWQGICRALRDHTLDIRDVCDGSTLHDIPIRNMTLFSESGIRQLHTLSRELLNISLNRINIVKDAKDPQYYFNLIEYLILYGVICTEILSLNRVLKTNLNLNKNNVEQLLKSDQVFIEAAGYSRQVSSSDIMEFLESENGDAENDILRLSLSQMALQSLFSANLKIEGNRIIIKNGKISALVFRGFAHTCLVRIPQIEAYTAQLLEDVFLCLRSNEDFCRSIDLEKNRDYITITADNFLDIRRHFRVQRRFGTADGKKYGPREIICSNLFVHNATAYDTAIPQFALTSILPGSSVKCSWDINNNSIVNLIIPHKGLNQLLQDLKKGKLFGYKLRYLYSGKMMLLPDSFFFIVSGIILTMCDLGRSAKEISGIMKYFSSVGFSFFNPLTYILGIKILYDLIHWLPWLNFEKIFDSLKPKKETEAE